MKRQRAAVEAAGWHVQAVEYEWREQDGREVLVWRLVVGDAGKPMEEDVQW